MNKPIDWSKPLQTRDGRKARLLGVLRGVARNHAVAVETMMGTEHSQFHFQDGSLDGACPNHRSDLINVPERIKREYWANVGAGGSTFLYRAREAADAIATVDRIACVKVVIECNEGEGLEGGK